MAVGQVFAHFFFLLRRRRFGHILDVEFFDGNQTIVVDDLSSALMNEIMSTVTNTLMDTTHYLFGFSPFVTVPLLQSQVTLCFCQRVLVLAEETRIVDKLSVGKSGELVESNVNTDLLIRCRKRYRFDFDGETDKPFVVLPPNRAGFNLAFDRAMQGSLNGSDLGEIDSLLANLEACLRIGEAVITVALKAGKAGIIALLYAREEGVEREINTNGYVLQDLGVDRFDFWVNLGPFREMFLLFVAARRFTMHFIVVLALIKQAVVHVAAGVQSLI